MRGTQKIESIGDWALNALVVLAFWLIVLAGMIEVWRAERRAQRHAEMQAKKQPRNDPELHELYTIWK